MPVKDKDVLEYHSLPKPGKIEVNPTKPCLTSQDLSMAYTPGVAVPCLNIRDNPEDVYKYTSKGNLVAVISNGTAVLGLGNIGALAGKPVMEGKGVLFKRFANVDVFDIELNTENPDEIIKACQLLEPTFGGINLEDIKAPECFYIEEVLKKTLNIPVFHDDQHGTAIISGAALLNGIEISGKKIDEIKVVVSGAGAAAIASANFYVTLGVKLENVMMVDTKGVIYEGRKEGMNPYKERFAKKTKMRTLEDVMKDADVFLGCSVKGLVSKDMVRSMAKNPIIFAMANPDPEISYEDAIDARPDVIMATGRSDYPNQVNNVLGFPFIFRGALDVMATAINEEMKLAAARALTSLAKEEIPESVSRAYGGKTFTFGPEYIIPKPFDPRVLWWEAPAVAKAAVESGVARKPIANWNEYVERLQQATSQSREVMRVVISKAKVTKRKIVFPEGTNPSVLKACENLIDQRVAKPVLIGNPDDIKRVSEEHNISLDGMEIVSPLTSSNLEKFSDELFRLRQRKGYSKPKSLRALSNPIIYGLMLLRFGEADGMVAGANGSYTDTIRTVLPLCELRQGIAHAAGVHVMLIKGRVYLFADTTLTVSPDEKLLVEITLMAENLAKQFNISPRIALLSFSNFGDNDHPLASKIKNAVELLHQKYPDLIVDGEMHGDTALSPDISKTTYPHSRIQGDANVLIFPDLQSGNIAYKLVNRLSEGEVIGPILTGLKKPVNIVSYSSTPREIVNMAAITSMECNHS